MRRIPPCGSALLVALTTLAHHIDIDWLREAYRPLLEIQRPERLSPQSGLEHDRNVLPSTMSGAHNRSDAHGEPSAPPLRPTILERRVCFLEALPTMKSRFTDSVPRRIRCSIISALEAARSNPEAAILQSFCHAVVARRPLWLVTRAHYPLTDMKHTNGRASLEASPRQ
jgi:hypothetical protein